MTLLPFPPRRDGRHGGARVSAGLAEQLGARHELAVVYLRGPGEPSAGREVRAAAAIVEEVEHEGRPPSRLDLLGGTPSLVQALDVPEVRRRLSSLAAEWTPDVVQIEFPPMAQYLPTLRQCWRSPCVLVEHEPAVQAARDVRDRSRGLARARAAADLRAWRRFAQTFIRPLDAIVVFTEQDAAEARALGGDATVACIPFATVIPEEALDPVGEAERVVFVGSFLHPPNVDAARRLVGGILPRLVASHPSLRLAIVGQAPPAEVRALAGDCVDVFGDVADVAPFLDRAAVVVAPARMGGGMRVKVLEAVAAGKAVVASPLAARGLALEHGREILVADTDERFARDIDALLTNIDRRVELARAAREWAVANVSWEATAACFESLYRSLARGSR